MIDVDGLSFGNDAGHRGKTGNLCIGCVQVYMGIGLSTPEIVIAKLGTGGGSDWQPRHNHPSGPL